MMNSEQTTSADEIGHINRFRWLLVLAWSGIVVALTLWMLQDHRHGLETLNLMHARAYIEKDVAYRRWNAMRGGVYAPMDELTPPNPDLKLPHRDVTTTAGAHLTLINPAYMTRQVHELIAQDQGVLGHITSLKPIRPGNAADPWEIQALQAFEQQGATEFNGVSEVNGKPYLRHMQPLFVEQPCLKCHEVQGYKLGQIRGGISVSIPYAPIQALSRDHGKEMAEAGLVFWLFGLIGILFTTGGLLKAARARLEIEQQLRSSEARLALERDRAQQYLDVAGVMLLALDAKGVITLLNPRGEAILGYGKGELLGRNWFELCLPKHCLAEVREVFRALLAGELESVEYHENPVLTASGEERLIAWHSALLRDETGAITGTLGSGLDITPRKQAEAKFQTLFNSLPDAVFIINMEGQLIEVNDLACKRLGYSREELLQMSPADIDTPEYAAKIRERIKTIQEQGQLVFETAQVCKDGKVIPTELSNSLIDYDGRPAVIGVARDITERKAAAEEIRKLNATLEERVRQRTAELQHSESQIQVMLQSLAEALIEVDGDGRILLINPEAERLLRWSGEQARGKHVGELIQLCHADGRAIPVEESCIARTLQSGEINRNDGQWLKRTDGSRFFATCVASPIVGEGRVKGVVAVLQDITGR